MLTLAKGMLTSFFFIFIALLFKETFGCQDIPVGIADRSIIPDNRFTATSQYNHQYIPDNARLYVVRLGWGTKTTTDPNDYLQIDLGEVFFICAVATQGCSIYSEWTTQYKISTSVDNNTWTMYKDCFADKLFAGNTDGNTAVKNIFEVPTSARFIRFIPTAYHKWKVLRVEAYGSKNGCQDSPVGIADSSIIPDNRFTASSHYDGRYAPKYARLTGATPGWGPKTTTDPNDYLQIDLGVLYVICAVATQGCSICSEWTTQYKISTSIDNITWTNYQDGAADKLFTGNTDGNTVVKNVFDVDTRVRFIRFIPTAYHTWKVLRVEAYGLKKDVSCNTLPVGIGNGKIPDSDMTSSSTYNSTTSPSKARLGYTAGSSWCAATSDSSPYLQINLGSPYIICGIATQGDHMTDQWIQSYHMTVSTDGTTFKKYMENKSFDGNFNSNTVVNNVLYDGTIGQYIRVTPTSHYGTTSCMRTELYGIQQNGGCTSMVVGLSYSSMIPDHRFTASSYYNLRYAPSNGRLIRSTKGWGPKTNSTGDWMQIDLGSLVYVCAVATQGGGSSSDEFVSRYKIRMSLDNMNWNYYQENNFDKVLTGNTDSYSVVTHNLTNPTNAKFIRFYPTAFNRWPTMRAEVYGVSSACNSPVELEDPGIFPNSKMTSSSYLDNIHNASHGRLYGNSSWCSSTSSNNQYLQINLGKVMTVTGIATQGDHAMDKWVKNYTFSYSIDGNIWNIYKAERNTNKVLQGNVDRNSIVVRWLSHPLTARHVRVTPQTWNTAICMRMELYGCNYPTRPVITGLTNQNLTAAAYSYVDLVCIVQEPLIQYIKWYTGNTDITSQSTGLVSGVNINSSTLRINNTSADDVLDTFQCVRSGKVYCSKLYICRAMYQNTTNNDTDGIKSAGVSVTLDYPSILATPTVDNITSTSVTVRWTKPVIRPLQARLTTYILQYHNSTGTQTINLAPTAVSHVISGLAIYTSYSVKLKAVSRIGDGQWSLARNFRTDSASPSQAPDQFSVTILSSTSVRLSWSLPPINSRNGIIRGFEVYFKKTGSGERATTKDIPGNSTLTHVINGLGKYTTYTFKVLAYTEPNKKGPYSNIIDKTTNQDAPSAPTNLQLFEIAPRGSMGPQIKLTWDAPSSPNGVIQGYIVSFKQSNDPSAINETKVVSGVSVTFPVFGGVIYWFIVEALTIKRGEQTTKIVKVKVYAPPSPKVKRISSITASKTNVTLWEASSTNGPIRAYQVIVIEIVDVPLFNETKLNKSKEWKLHYYIAAEINMKSETLPKIFTLGDEKVYNGYKNMKLQEGKTYNVTQRALTQDEKLVFLPGPSSLIAKGNVQETRERCNCKEPPAPTKTCFIDPPYHAVSLAFNALFAAVIILLIVFYNRKLKNQLVMKDRNRSENRKSALSQIVYENKSADSSEDGLAMSTIPTNSKSTYEQIDLVDKTARTVHRQADMAGHHTTTDTGVGDYQPINVITDPKQDTKSRPIYASLEPETKIRNRQESPKESSSQSPTYQCLQENRSKPVYQSLHTFGNKQAKGNGEYNV